MTNNKTIFEGPIMVRGKGVGFFVIPDSPEEAEDILIVRENLGFALDGDIVKIELLPKVAGERQAAKVLEVIEQKNSELVGVVKAAEDGKPERYLQPDNYRIHVRPQLPAATAADEGMKVVVEITNWTSPHTEPTAEITEVIGRAGDHETEMQAIIRSGGFSENFPEVISQAADELYKSQDEIFAAALKDPKRRDLRNRTTMTIDPADAKDFDDAISLQNLENGNYEIGIHIADVSHYVKEGDIIDKEAKERGTSIYLVDRVIPMLPEVLSNDLCSLRPNEDRLAFSALFEINNDAHIVSQWYGQTVINSNKRFSYEDAQTILDQQSGEYLEELNTLMKLGRLLRKRRYKNGAIAFEQPEVKFVLDENGKPIDVITKVRTETMMMIEDYMLLANQSVAEYIDKLAKEKNQDTNFIYRIHDVPDPDRIEELSIFLHALGYEFNSKNGIIDAKAINRLLAEVENKPEENLIKTATIRSMAKAIYSTKNIGHFGLAFKHYTHFTSPIRRYPDMMSHRMLRRHLDGSRISSQEMLRYEKTAAQASEREMYAVKAERDSIKFKQVEYMSDKIGQTFTATISGVSDWGVYVAEKESMAEGMIRLGALKDDYYTHESSKYRIKGGKNGQTFSLGDEVKVKLVRADLENRQLDFELAK